MSNTLMEERMKEAIEAKNLDLNSFVWKGEKRLDENGKYKQQEKKLVDMDSKELNQAYNRCKTMLFNRDSKNPGRYLVLELISDQKDRCGAELFVRYVEQENTITRFSLLNMINGFLSNNKETFKNIKPILSHAFSNIPNEYEQLSLSLIMDACLDRLGAFNKKHVTRSFVLRQGIWLTPSEAKDLVEYDSEGKPIDRLTIIRDRLGVKDVETLYINSRGLNYTQMRAMLNLKPNKKYMDLTTAQLETLRYRILFNLEETVKKHIADWEYRMEQIELVANHKGVKL